MESTFVWILMFAGAAVALLGIFLVASERELKNKRREIDGLLARLENGEPATAPAGTEQSPNSDAESELRAQNRDLENKLAGLSSELTQSRQTIDALQRAQHDGAGEREEEMKRLDAANQQLAREAAELRNRLAASETDLQTARREDSQPALNRMQAEIEELRRTLESSHSKVRELEAAQQNLPDLNAIQAERNSERQNFQEQITNLEKRLATEQQNLAEAQGLRERIAEAENVQRSLRDEIQRYENEIPQWQARIAAAEEGGRRLAALQAPCNELLAQHADLAERQRRLQDELAAFSRQITAPAENFLASATQPNSPSTATLETNSTATQPRAAAASDSPTHRFGVFGALFLIAATGITGFQFISSEWEQPTEQIAIVRAAEQAAPTVVTASTSLRAEPQVTTREPAVNLKPTVISAEPSKPAVREAEALAAKRDRPAAHPTLAVGTYRVIQPSRVYAAPNELSYSLGDIEPGISVNVVDARNGWLEIHSKHGRPPGFIRREVAARIASAN